MQYALNIQTIIFGILACLILLLSFFIVIVVFVGILRIAIISVFEFDPLIWWKKKKVNHKTKKQECDLPRIYTKSMGDKDEG